MSFGIVHLNLNRCRSRWQVPTLGDIATSVILGDGEDTVVTWIPSSEVVISEGTFGQQYSFAALDANNEPCVLKGGSRLINAWKKAVAAAPKNVKQLNKDGYRRLALAVHKRTTHPWARTSRDRSGRGRNHQTRLGG